MAISLPVLRCHLLGLFVCLSAPAGAAGPPILQDPDAITLTGIYRDGAPCGHVLLQDGTRVLMPSPLHGIAPGTRVTVRGERMSDKMGCGGPALVIRGWQAAPG